MKTRYRYGPPLGRRMMRRRMMAMMAHDHDWCGGRYADHRPHGDWQPSATQELLFLEEYQRDLEEALADVADRVKDIRQAANDGGDQPGRQSDD